MKNTSMSWKEIVEYINCDYMEFGDKNPFRGFNCSKNINKIKEVTIEICEKCNFKKSIKLIKEVKEKKKVKKVKKGLDCFF